ncbi:ATP-dependent helicase [Bifidobacterium tissieri]|uniref:DNA 3'-5' helicase n=1 Tax=Bifidobacterium tissieri TaxID=1630162 RepID=A0A5M9ZPR7_9BIFI|nr:ATP-dependent DNA helicase [Bifidobacterium tissieri]KAA8828842.1 ATP-dependent helicase [Bifidobacterium tissieri]KAA8832956.1 ATP-dependent helicase [Bifidobacterium tissieri]
MTATDEQEAVINAPVNDDILVVAGAGSGKTYTMTNRIIALIERGVPAERILGLTFTRKAASELLDRVSGAVTKAMHTDAARGADPDRAFLKPEIYTYDAFFQSIVRQYGLLVGMDQNTQPLSEAGAYQLASDVVGKHMALLFASSHSDDGLDDTGVPNVDGDDSPDMGQFSVLTTRLMDLSHAIANAMIGGDVPTFHDAVERIRAWDTAFIARMDALIGDEPIPEKDPSKTKPKKRKKSESAADYARRVEAYRHACALYHADALRDVARRRELLLTLAEEFQNAKRRAGMAEFSDFTIAAFQLIRRFPSIGEEYRRRYSHVFLDEYQDTSTTQATLLAALFHMETKPGAGTASGASGSHTAVNAVGDPFQSIYAWRGASPGAFRMFQHDFGMDASRDNAAAPYRPYALTRTHRNPRIVLEAANDLTLPLRRAPRRLSSSLMREVDVDVLKPWINPDGTPSPLGTVGVQGYVTRGQEIDATVRFALKAKELYGVDEHGKTVNGTHVAVLFRSKSMISEYCEALEQAGLTCEVVGYSALLDRPEIKDLLALLHAVADHTDTGALMRLMATPRFAIGADDLKIAAKLADNANLEYRYRALVTAGFATGDEPRREWKGIVNQHRDIVPNGVFLADLLLSSDFAHQLDGTKVSERGKRLLLDVAAMLRVMESRMHLPLPDVLRIAVEQLGLDIDCVVAQAVAGHDGGHAPTAARAPMDAIADLSDTYLQELPENSAPSLRGFITWIDALSKVPETGGGQSSGKADVTLMTIHQAKGLQWDAVVVAGLTAKGFPSSQGDSLSVNIEQYGIMGADGRWTPPEYRETARTWLDDQTAVPVPVRVDSAILPRFPHDADVDGDPIAQLDVLDTVERVDQEVYAPGRNVSVEDSADDADDEFLSQSEEYGRRLHADERRLMYVALTRAKRAALLTFSADRNNLSRMTATLSPDDLTDEDDLADDAVDDSSDNTLTRADKAANDIVDTIFGMLEKSASNFWMEVHEALVGRSDVVGSPTNLPDGIIMPDGRVRFSYGFFAGDHAEEYENAVVGEAWLDPVEQTEHELVPWPRPLAEPVATAIKRSVDAVRTANTDTANTTDSTKNAVPRTLLDYAHEVMRTRTASTVGSDDIDILEKQGKRILASGRQNVTAIQKRMTLMADNASTEVKVDRAYDRKRYRMWAGIIRPIPRSSSPAAEAGTQFHNWAARFICPQGDGMIQTADSIAMLPQDMRATMIDELVKQDQALANGTLDARERHLLTWQHRLIDSRWAKRNAVCVEQSIVADLDGQVVNGKLDAVFSGGLDDPSDDSRFTVVDWKTGRKPTDTQDIEEKLAQLDLYRLLWSRIREVPLERIDATLYYLSVDDESERELHALPRSEDEIISLVLQGMPTPSDND